MMKQKTLVALFAAALLFVLGGTLWAYGSLRAIKEPLILHFNDAAGITQVGSSGNLLGIGALGVVMVAMNFFIAAAFVDREKFLALTVAAATLFMSILLFSGFLAIISVN